MADMMRSTPRDVEAASNQIWLEHAGTSPRSTEMMRKKTARVSWLKLCLTRENHGTITISGWFAMIFPLKPPLPKGTFHCCTASVKVPSTAWGLRVVTCESGHSSIEQPSVHGKVVYVNNMCIYIYTRDFTCDNPMICNLKCTYYGVGGS